MELDAKETSGSNADTVCKQGAGEGEEEEGGSILRDRKWEREDVATTKQSAADRKWFVLDDKTPASVSKSFELTPRGEL